MGDPLPGRSHGPPPSEEKRRCADADGEHAALRCAATTTLKLKYQPRLHPLLAYTPHPPTHTMTTTTNSDSGGLTVELAMILRFPPFPVVPDGVELVPFHSFRPSGIRVPIDVDDEDPNAPGVIERDGLGIPTVALRVKHVADNAEKKKKRKKKAVGSQQVQVAPEKPKMWWEVWEELEDVRRNVYDANMAPIDRLYQAGVDFKNGRTWPTTFQGVSHVWDIFRIYIGLLQQTPVPPKDVTPNADAGSDDTDSDSDSTDDALAGTKDDGNQMEFFLNNPELSMKIFFSSHFRERGLIWSEPRCLSTPILVSFFLRYLIRSCVFPEPEYERPMKRALELVELARIELPNSWKMGRALPDAFSDGCKGLWGSMQAMWVVAADAASSSTDQPEAKRRKLEDSEDTQSPSPEKTSTDVDPPAEIAAESDPAPVGAGWGTAEGGEDLPGWGTTAETWDDTHALASSTEDEGKDAVHELAPPIWDASLVDIDVQATWDLEPPTLLPLLGPSALPLTHTTGVVEQSTRRIVRVDPPRAPRALAQNAPPAEAVEEDLACRFARLVLAPWERLDQRTYGVGSDVLPPTVLSTSRSVVAMEEEDEEKGVAEGGGSVVPVAVGAAHRPWKDEIAVLVDPKLTDVLLAGMGIGAIWVEIVRDKEAEGSYAVASSKKGKSKKKEVPKYWYMEQLVHQLPSFYIDKPEEV
ncbi:hypothetical protein BJV74DRAFT_595128 [Russula compacta]|nr:hypothetical protein BJV74DRAFT_595128 [Russula compacta]